MHPTAAPIKPRINIANIHAPHSDKHLPPTNLHSVTGVTPNTKLLSPKIFDKVYVTKIVKQLIGNKYIELPNRREGVPTRHKHYTRALTQDFLAQSVIKMDDKG